jgi:hypothetical protein
MHESKRTSADINQGSEEPRAVLVTVRSGSRCASRNRRERAPQIRELIEDRFRQLVYEIPGTRSSLNEARPYFPRYAFLFAPF